MAQMSPLIGLDLGGTSLKAGLVNGGKVENYVSVRLKADGSVEEIMEQIYALLDRLSPASCLGIGVGAPSVIDMDTGMVLDTQNIPSWKHRPVALRDLLKERYRIPVEVNNDANCFALGEKYFGKARGFSDLVAVTIGTGIGSGLILNGRLYTGRNCGAGEFGMIPFREHNLEYYASGQFFMNVYDTPGEIMAERVARGDEQALHAFREFGRNVGEAVKIIMYAVDPELLIFGGSVSRSFAYFEKSLRESFTSFVYPRSIARLQMAVSDTPHVAVLGAASLCLEYPEST
jgi:glucokinase